MCIFLNINQIKCVCFCSFGFEECSELRRAKAADGCTCAMFCDTLVLVTRSARDRIYPKTWVQCAFCGTRGFAIN